MAVQKVVYLLLLCLAVHSRADPLVDPGNCPTTQELMEKLDSLSNILTDPPKGTFTNPATSCKDLPDGSPSGEYWIHSRKRFFAIRMYCNMTKSCCDVSGGWTRVASVDMSDPSQLCPSGFRQVTRATEPLRTCGRPRPGCVNTSFPTYGMQYSHICGKLKGYQVGSPDGFFINKHKTTDEVFVDGVSLTHGESPRNHIWTFVNSRDDTDDNCPCGGGGGQTPPFIGQDYFCDTGSRQKYERRRFYEEDPLWDGQGCGGTSTCCSFNNPPWFCKQLRHQTTDDIDLRLCADNSILDEDILLEEVEIYVR